MARIRVIYDETENKILKLDWWGDLKLDATRRIQSSKHRYCLHGSTFFTPDYKILELGHRLSWGLIDPINFEKFPFLDSRDELLPISPDEILKRGLIISGSNYAKRHREQEGKRVPVSEFLAAELFNKIIEDGDNFDSLNKSQFEEFCAEIFARRGFDVELFRTTKDNGIDFLAITGDALDPIIWSVQCKLPDKQRKNGKKARSVTVSEVREIYGTAKAYDHNKAILISGTSFSPEAKKFQKLKPSEIELIDKTILLEWLCKFRWNSDE